MYSLNVPLPAQVTRLASRLARELPQARARPRGEHTLVCTRLGETDGPRLAARARDALAGTGPFELRIDGIDCFETAATGPSPVVYLSVESPYLERLHRTLAETFDPVEGIEGDEYVPHVTIARGGDLAAASRLAERSIEPITWTAENLVVFDSDRTVTVRELSLPL